VSRPKGKDMRKFLIVLGAVIAVLVVSAFAIYFSGATPAVVAFLFAPHHGWDLKYKVPPPDYADANAWAALPSRPGLSALVPAGVAPAPKDSPVDVFFIHPTGYTAGVEWNSPLDPSTKTEENTHWMMANQASVFNGCCAIYAPRYREATIYRYIDAPPDIFKKAGDFAYADVDRAFTFFLEHYSKGRPFIIASHSQGTEHGFNLIARRIAGTPLAQRLVAAYLIGGGITDKDVDALKSVHACATPTDTHCIVHWATYAAGSKPVRDDVKSKILCVNPLTWKRDGGFAPARLSQGAVPTSGRFQFDFWTDRATGVNFGPLGAPLKGWTSAECRGGLLFAGDQSRTPFRTLAIGENYHGLDYPLWAMDIRQNAIARVNAYLAQQR